LPIKQWITWSLLFAFSWPYIYKSGVILNFYINRDKIAKENCIQKNIPNNCCKGSCQLNQALAKVNQPETPTEKPIQIVVEDFLLDHCQFHFLSIPQSKSEILSHFYLMPKLKNCSTSIEHPPQVC
jgi:hypothetical protein